MEAVVGNAGSGARTAGGIGGKRRGSTTGSPSLNGNENALMAGCAGVGPSMDSKSAGLRVMPPAFSMALSIP